MGFAQLSKKIQFCFLINKRGVIRSEKFSPKKLSLPGKKQVYRILKNGFIQKDVIGLEKEKLGKPLLALIFKKGKLIYKIPSIKQNKKYTMNQLSLLPERYKNIFKEFKPLIEVSDEIINLLKIVKSQHLFKN